MTQYQAVFRSGVSDDCVPKLRHSVELYKLFDQYCQVYYASDEWHGPSATMTESTSCANGSWRLVVPSVSYILRSTIICFELHLYIFKFVGVWNFCITSISIHGNRIRSNLCCTVYRLWTLLLLSITHRESINCGALVGVRTGMRQSVRNDNRHVVTLLRILADTQNLRFIVVLCPV